MSHFGLANPFVKILDATFQRVITSYSIHYTKLYDVNSASGEKRPVAEAFGPDQQAAQARPGITLIKDFIACSQALLKTVKFVLLFFTQGVFHQFAIEGDAVEGTSSDIQPTTARAEEGAGRGEIRFRRGFVGEEKPEQIA